MDLGNEINQGRSDSKPGNPLFGGQSGNIHIADIYYRFGFFYYLCFLGPLSFAEAKKRGQ
jgi:hypothetical protein